MSILWVCDTVVSRFASEFGLQPTIVGGWVEGMLCQMEKRAEIALCFPLMDSWRKKDGEGSGHKYYSFSYSAHEYSIETEERFIEILNEYKPDIVHIWGTEFPHTLAMLNACEKTGLQDRAVVNIQGLVEPCSLHYLDHIPDSYAERENENGDSLRTDQREFAVKGRYEREALHKVKYVIGRTDWDCAWIKHINPNSIYYYGGEILRDGFYETNKKWAYETCEKYSVFVSQAGYSIKGFDYLLYALPDIIREYPDVHVYVAGTNPMVPYRRTGCMLPYGIYLKKLIEDRKLQDRVTFLGRLNAQQMIGQYIRANVFVSCSRIENSSNSVCEAAMIGTPIVASYVGGMDTLAQKISNIYLYTPGETHMLAFYIRKVFEMGQFNGQTGEIQELMDRDKNAELTWQVYQEIKSRQV